MAETKGELPPEDERRLRALLGVLEQFERVSPNMPVGMVTAWLHVALNEGASLVELVHHAGRPQSTMSRYLLDLSGHRRRSSGGEPLPELIQWRISPEELRRKSYTLSTRGRGLLRHILSALSRVEARAERGREKSPE